MRLCRLFPQSRMTALVTDRWMGSRTWKEREREQRRGKFFSSMDDSGDDTFSHMLLLRLAHTNKHIFSFIRLNFAQWNINTSSPFCTSCSWQHFSSARHMLMSKLASVLSVEYLVFCLVLCSNTIFKLQLEISNISPSNLADKINKCKWETAAFITAAKGIWILAL